MEGDVFPNMTQPRLQKGEKIIHSSCAYFGPGVSVPRATGVETENSKHEHNFQHCPTRYAEAMSFQT